MHKKREGLFLPFCLCKLHVLSKLRRFLWWFCTNDVKLVMTKWRNDEMTFWKTGVRVKEIVYINIYIYIYYFFEGFSPKSEVENVISSFRHFVINTPPCHTSSATLPMGLAWVVGRWGYGPRWSEFFHPRYPFAKHSNYPFAPWWRPVSKRVMTKWRNDVFTFPLRSLFSNAIYL